MTSGLGAPSAMIVGWRLLEMTSNLRGSSSNSTGGCGESARRLRQRTMEAWEYRGQGGGVRKKGEGGGEEGRSCNSKAKHRSSYRDLGCT
eukprot:359692-Chlamydomonas_euryale.AAC.8